MSVLFNELVFMDYFDAYEFRNKKNEIHNKIYQLPDHCYMLFEDYPYLKTNKQRIWELPTGLCNRLGEIPRIDLISPLLP